MNRITLLLTISLLFCGAHVSAQRDKAVLARTTFDRENPYIATIYREMRQMSRHYHTFYNRQLLLIVDLCDTSNHIENWQDTLSVIDQHVYHIASGIVYDRVSVLMVPCGGHLYFFEGLNCTRYRHRTEDVVQWMIQNFDGQPTDELLHRVRHYDDYYHGVAIDPQGSKSYCENCRKKSPTRTRCRAPRKRKV